MTKKLCVEVPDEKTDKACGACGFTCAGSLVRQHFHKDRSRRDGWSGICKRCSSKEKKRAWAALIADPEAHRADKARKARDREKNGREGVIRRESLRLERVYGLTLAGYKELLAEQGGGCAICGAVDARSAHKSGTRYKLVVDHNHATGEVRGLLCNPCNRGLGFMGEDEGRLFAAVRYLRRHAPGLNKPRKAKPAAA
jgi:hypothetical protein